MKKLSRIYLDYAASTPVDPAVLKAMTPYFTERFGNPGSLHSFGQEAMGAVDKARETVAKALGADFRSVIFAGSATEANNLAFRGTMRRFWWNFFKENGRKKKPDPAPHVITTAIEHESVLETLLDIERRGAARVTILPVNRDGVVETEAVKKALEPATVLVSVMYVNNEIGSVQPIKEISRIVKDYRKDKKYPLFHTDASQTFNYFDCDVKKLGVDLMTLSGQKIYGPKGAGALCVRDPSLLSPLVVGGGQEFGLRSGTENVPSIVGFAEAVKIAEKNRKESFKKVSSLKNAFWRGLKKVYPQAEVNGGSGAPHILNIHFPTEFAGDLLVKLDMAGIAASGGSACSARSYAPSPVLQALGLSQERVRGSLRFSFGKNLDVSDIKEALKRMEKILV
jgi:cysteine desulfurase